MRTLRRAYRRRFGRHARFNFAVVLTILVQGLTLRPLINWLGLTQEGRPSAS